MNCAKKIETLILILSRAFLTLLETSFTKDGTAFVAQPGTFGVLVAGHVLVQCSAPSGTGMALARRGDCRDFGASIALTVFARAFRCPL